MCLYNAWIFIIYRFTKYRFIKYRFIKYVFIKYAFILHIINFFLIWNYLDVRLKYTQEKERDYDRLNRRTSN